MRILTKIFFLVNTTANYGYLYIIIPKLRIMKKTVAFFSFFIAFCAVALASCVIDGNDKVDFSVRDNSQTVIIFLHSPTCGYSTAAKQYIDETYPNVAIVYIDVDQRGNADYLKAAKQDYGAGEGRSQVDTPVICMGNNFIEGWDFYKREKLDLWIKPYLREK